MGSSSYLSILYSYSFVENERKNCDKKEWKDNFFNSILQSLKRHFQKPMLSIHMPYYHKKYILEK
jgi:hypothetical protein